MKLQYKDLSNKLAKYNIRPSIQRIKILDYLINNQCHPAVDQIYRDLHDDIPTLSKTTVYNTMTLFIEAGLVKELTIEENVIRYDIVTDTHGHFKCLGCGAIINFVIDAASINGESLTGFKILDRNVYFKGLCPKCLSNINPND